MSNKLDLYIITTANKRDKLDWNKEAARLSLTDINEHDSCLVVDSWNNIHKYKEVKGGFFIFDEQKVIGNGVWVKSFLKIVKNNLWILLSATPGDTWFDYIPLFIANGFFKNKTDFLMKHVVYDPRVPWPKVKEYINEDILFEFRDSILVPMGHNKKATRIHKTIDVGYNEKLYRDTIRSRWDPYKNEPIINTSQFFNVIRRIINSDKSRINAVKDLLLYKKKMIIFYNFDYELTILETLSNIIPVYQYNGHIHDPVPINDKWVYLVHYSSSEGWECITTDTILFYSLNYSYKILEQASGRIDRLTTPYKFLYYYSLISNSPLDMKILEAQENKEIFSESKTSHGLQRL